jgi:hypothetical protein
MNECQGNSFVRDQMTDLGECNKYFNVCTTRLNERINQSFYSPLRQSSYD